MRLPFASISFYNQHSSFTHGGLDLDPSKDESLLIVGQKNIHDKIQQLNFRDCHAKITYVDAQATLGDGVVVQVSGELSNDGCPMRRFTQTFVLACQSPKKYYVHNDIFRYQDLYTDDDQDSREDSHDATDVSNTDNSTSMLVQQPQAVFFPGPPNPPGIVSSANFVPQPMQANPAAPQVNGVMHEELLKNMSTQTTQAPQSAPIVQQQQQQQQVAQVPIMAPAPAALPMPIEPVASPEIVTSPMVVEVKDNGNQYEIEQSNGDDSGEESKETDQSIEEIAQVSVAPQQQQHHQQSSPPKNWANMVKGGNTLVGFTPAPEVAATPQPTSFVAITQQQQQQAQQRKFQENYSDTVIRQPRSSVNPPAPAPRTNDREVRERERRTSGTNYNDGNCQLFLGNLPNRATEEELKQIFSVFGKIVDLRIHTKPQQKNAQNRPVPNYGFITFEDPVSAEKLQNSQVSLESFE